MFKISQTTPTIESAPNNQQNKAKKNVYWFCYADCIQFKDCCEPFVASQPTARIVKHNFQFKSTSNLKWKFICTITADRVFIPHSNAQNFNLVVEQKKKSNNEIVFFFDSMAPGLCNLNLCVSYIAAGHSFFSLKKKYIKKS